MQWGSGKMRGVIPHDGCGHWIVFSIWRLYISDLGKVGRHPIECVKVVLGTNRSSMLSWATNIRDLRLVLEKLEVQ